MGYPDMKCMIVNIWIHHMQIDELFDFLCERVDTPPPYWYNHEECPYSVTGGYVMISLDYSQLSNLRSYGDWADPLTEYNKIEDSEDWSEWDSTLNDGLDIDLPYDDDFEDFIDLE